jgi:mono/diheme cytochrome c family protein
LRALVTGLAAAALAFAAVALATDGGGEAGPPPASRAAHSSGRELFARMGCGSCHRFAAAGSTGQIGPDLDLKLPNHTRDSLIAKIVSPGEASVMPANFRGRMDDDDLAALANFLLASQRSP